MPGRVAVLGAGLQGACVAMDLADSGWAVDLYDRDAEPMTQASLQNEGKIHLGYVYAKDRTMRSALAMIEGAATFGPLLERWLAIPMSALAPSSPFRYAVHRNSQLTSEEFAEHLHRTHEMGARRIAQGEYFGLDVTRPPVRLGASELEQDYDPASVTAAYQTCEISIDPRQLARAVRARIAGDPRISALTRTVVTSVVAGRDELAVNFEAHGEPGQMGGYSHIVNALWDGRLVVDGSIGLVPERAWLFRVKHFLTLETRSSARLASTTVVLGPFGDVVDYGDGSFYLSWYPTGMVASTTGVHPPPAHLDDDAREALRDGIIAGLTTIVPGLADVPPADLAAADVRGGAIFAWGESDIDDTASGLHERYATGPLTVGRYHTVDTGKLTTAPLYARAVADRIRANP